MLKFYEAKDVIKPVCKFFAKHQKGKPIYHNGYFRAVEIITIFGTVAWVPEHLEKMYNELTGEESTYYVHVPESFFFYEVIDEEGKVTKDGIYYTPVRPGKAYRSGEITR